jgi:AraC-like DNA-binding protein
MRGGTMSVLAARPAVEALKRRHIDPGPCLRAAEIRSEALAHIENRLPAVNVGKLWETASIAARDCSFGVHVAEETQQGHYDLLEYLFTTSETLGEGLRRCVEYIRLIQEPAPLRLVVEPLSALIVRPGVIHAPQYDEFSMTLLLVRSRQATGVDLRPQRVQFRHPRPDNDGEVERVFRCPVKFGVSPTEMKFRRSLLRLPLVRHDSRLLAILERYAASLMPPNDGHTLVGRASHAITMELARKPPTLAATARSLHMSARTLQRQLAHEGRSHSALVDDVRRALALQHIGDASVTITALSYILHFSDPGAFYRAFKRWTGKSPRAYREDVLHLP